MTTPTPIRISNSEIQTFKDCRRRWWLGYYRGLKRIDQKHTGPLAFGTRVHKALEDYYNDMSTPILEHWSRIVKEDREILDAEWMDTSAFDNEAELGRIMLEGFMQWNAEEGIDSELEIVSNEERLSAPFLDGKVELMAKVDQRVRRKVDGVRLFRDWKTTANFNDLTATGQLNEQFLTYQILEMIKKDESERCEGALITMLKKVKRTEKAKPPFYDQMEIRHNLFTLRNFWTRLHGVLGDMVAVREALDNGVDHQQVVYPRPTRDCTWKCDFYALCPMFDDGSAVEQAIEMNYREGDAYDYYGVIPEAPIA